MMSAAEAISGRQSIRAYLDTPVPRATIERILLTAGRAPSGSNIQPWKVHVLTGAAKQRFSADLHARHAAGDEGEREYNYYPVAWREPYLGRRRACGWGLYDLLGLGKGDREKTRAQHGRNFLFFGAPVGLVFTIDRDMELGSWLDMGMFLQSVMIAARGEGLATCPQAAFCWYHARIRELLTIPQSEIVVCGMALGHPDPAAQINTYTPARLPLEDFVTWHDG